MPQDHQIVVESNRITSARSQRESGNARSERSEEELDNMLWIRVPQQNAIKLFALLTAYFGSLATCITFWSKAGDTIARRLSIHDVWIARGLAFIPFALVLGVHGIPEVLRGFRKNRVIVPGHNNYVFRVAPYEDTKEDRARFTRADNAHKNALNWILHSNSAILYLTGLSGAGKSSLLNAFIIPQLNGKGSPHRAVLFPRFGNIGILIRAAILRPGFIWAHPPQRGSIRKLLEEATNALRPGRLILIIDQFEECLVHRQIRPRRETFIIALINFCQRTPIPGLTLLLSFRSDYRPFLEENEFMPPLPSLHATFNWYEVAPFKVADAKQFLQAANLILPPIVEERVFKQIARTEDSPDFVRPVILNMVGLVLTQRSRDKKRLVGRREAGGFLRTYVLQAIRSADRNGSSRVVARSLIAVDGTRRVMSIEDINAATGLRPGVITSTLKDLQEHGLTRSLDSRELNWEVSHDFVARLISDVLRLWKRSPLQKARMIGLPLSMTIILALACVYFWHKPEARDLINDDLGYSIDPTSDRQPGEPLNEKTVLHSFRANDHWQSASLLKLAESSNLGFFIAAGNYVWPSSFSDIATIPFALESGIYEISARMRLSTAPFDSNLSPYLGIGYYLNNVDGYLWTTNLTVLQLVITASDEWRLMATAKTQGGDKLSASMIAHGQLYSLEWATNREVLLKLSWNVDKGIASCWVNGSEVATNIRVGPLYGVDPRDVHFVGFGSDIGLGGISRPGPEWRVSRFRVEQIR